VVAARQPQLSSSTTSSVQTSSLSSCNQSSKMSSIPDPDYPEDFLAVEAVYGSIPRAHLDHQRPPLPLPETGLQARGSPRHSPGSGHQGQGHNQGHIESHYYASAGTIQREVGALRSHQAAAAAANDYYSAPYSGAAPLPAHMHAPLHAMGGLPTMVNGNYGNDPEYVSKVSSYIKESGRKHAARRDLEGLVAAIGFIGVILSLASLAAYLAVQAPHLRKAIGPTYASEFHEDQESAEVSRKLQTANVIYGVELACCITMALLLLLTDALLIHGVRKKSAAFLIPWLIVRSLLLALAITAIVLILIFVRPAAFKSLCIVPAVVAILVYVCWVKVFKLYKLTRRQFKPPKAAKQTSYSDYTHYSPEMTRQSPYASSKPKKAPDQY